MGRPAVPWTVVTPDVMLKGSAEAASLLIDMGYGRFGYLLKSGLRFSTKALRPSCPSSLM